MSLEWINALPIWPVEISAHAAHVDVILAAFLFVMAMFAAPVFVVMAWFAVRYRRGSAARREGRPRGSPWLEMAWAAIPLAVMLVFFVEAARTYVEQRAPIDGALRIDVVAKQWMWKFQHANGRRQINRLHVPADTPVELHMISQDVIHSLFLPALRIKQDVLPGRYTTLNFTARTPGEYHLACAEYCGTLHSRMGGALVVMEPARYEQWLARDGELVDPVTAGRRIYGELGCDGCHDSAAPLRAPPLEGLYDSQIALAGGGVTRADESYLRESIVRPAARVRAGFEPVMPSYDGLVDEDEIKHLLAWIRSLGASTAR